MNFKVGKKKKKAGVGKSLLLKEKDVPERKITAGRFYLTMKTSEPEA